LLSDLRTIHLCHGGAEVEMHAVRFMQALHKAAQFFTQYLLHRHLVGRDHVHLDAAFAQGVQAVSCRTLWIAHQA
jgi:hypothetical protein